MTEADARIQARGVMCRPAAPASPNLRENKMDTLMQNMLSDESKTLEMTKRITSAMDGEDTVDVIMAMALALCFAIDHTVNKQKTFASVVDFMIDVLKVSPSISELLKQKELANMNDGDGGTFYSLKEIADYIEKNIK